MRVIEAVEFDEISGGEVGATGMGSDYYYTGEVNSLNDAIQCAGNNGSTWYEAVWTCMF
jgi:hypothetical protein